MLLIVSILLALCPAASQAQQSASARMAARLRQIASEVRDRLGIAYLRLGEQENCLLRRLLRYRALRRPSTGPRLRRGRPVRRQHRR